MVAHTQRCGLAHACCKLLQLAGCICGCARCFLPPPIPPRRQNPLALPPLRTLSRNTHKHTHALTHARAPTHPTCAQFGGGYVLSRLAVLATGDDRELREERARLLVYLGHLLKLYRK